MPMKCTKIRGALLLSGVSEFAQLQKAQLDIHFVTPGESSLQSPSYEDIKELHDREWDGVLLIYPFPAPVINSLQKLFPVVSLVQQLVQSPLNCVDVNHQRGIEMVVGHLAELGHERIGFLTNGYDLTAKWALCRYSAFLAETARIIRPPQPDDIIDPFTASKMSVAEIHRYAAAQNPQGCNCLGLCCGSSSLSTLLPSDSRGFTVPDDVSITGFDGDCPSYMGSPSHYFENSLPSNRADSWETTSRLGHETIRCRPSHFNRLYFSTWRNHSETMKTIQLSIYIFLGMLSVQSAFPKKLGS